MRYHLFEVTEGSNASPAVLHGHERNEGHLISTLYIFLKFLSRNGSLLCQLWKDAKGIPNDNMLTLHAYRMNKSSSALDSVSPASGDGGDGGDLRYYRAKVITLKFHTLNLRGRLSNCFLFVQRWESLLPRFEGE